MDYIIIHFGITPAKDFKQFDGELKEYYDNIFPLLYKGFSEKPTARYTSMPSFSYQYSFSIETIEGKNNIVRKLLVCKKQKKSATYFKQNRVKQ